MFAEESNGMLGSYTFFLRLQTGVLDLAICVIRLHESRDFVSESKLQFLLMISYAH